ncbi:hypothetical protein ACQFX6_00460 [Streptomyces sp. DSM 41987]|uniref:hypothetical protein n=1 Tax=Streptomyces TaxID=1883 RepID=UPI0018DF51F2|nr:hypothetical protein [Streptomyces fildesensis]
MIGLAAPLAVGAVLGYAAGAAVSVALSAGLTAVGATMERRQHHWDQQRCAEAVWEEAVAEVLARNARIEVTGAALSAYGHLPHRLPGPLALSRQQIHELRAWCAAADQALAVAENLLMEQDARQAAAWLTTGPAQGERPAPAAPHPATGPARDRHRNEHAVDPAADERESAVRAVRRLPPAVPHAERLRITAAAARVCAATTAIEARNRLDDLRRRVDLARAESQRRMADAQDAAAFLQVLSHVQDQEAAPLRETLQAVVRAEQPLESALRQAAVHWAETVRDVAEQHHVRQVLIESLQEMGYEVSGDFSTVTVEQGAFAVSHASWREHEVRMVLDDDSRELRAVVVRTGGTRSMNSARADVEREEQWCGSLEHLQSQLAEQGVGVAVRTLTVPGTRPTPMTNTLKTSDHDQQTTDTGHAEQQGR